LASVSNKFYIPWHSELLWHSHGMHYNLQTQWCSLRMHTCIQTHTTVMVTVSSTFTNSSFTFVKFGHMQPVILQLNLILTIVSNSGLCTAAHHTTNRTLCRGIFTSQNWVQNKCSYWNWHRVDKVYNITLWPVVLQIIFC
jgi:hypothetical protein